MGPLRRFRLAYDLSELFRRYFINTLFDSTFVVLGIVSATVVTAGTPIGVTLGAMAAACIAIGISSGVSVYEAERPHSHGISSGPNWAEIYALFRRAHRGYAEDRKLPRTAMR